MPRPVSFATPILMGLVICVLTSGSPTTPLRAAPDVESVRNDIRVGLPKYNPKIRENHLAQQEAMHRAADSATQYGVKQGATESLPTSDVPGKTITLPRIVVRPRDASSESEPAVQLPRIVVRPAEKDVPPAGFETPDAKAERLMEKHLSTFDRKFLNRLKLPPFCGTSNEQRARDAEAAEQSARRLNEISELVERSDTGEPETKEDRELKKAYLDAFVFRPK